MEDHHLWMKEAFFFFFFFFFLLQVKFVQIEWMDLYRNFLGLNYYT